MPNSQREPEPELPPPSAELILIGSIMRAYIRNLPKKQRMAVLQDVTMQLDDMARGVNVHNFRPRKDEAAVKVASLKARSWWRMALGPFVSGA